MCSNIFSSNFLAELAREIAQQKRRGVVKRASTFERGPRPLAVAKGGHRLGVRYSVLKLLKTVLLLARSSRPRLSLERLIGGVGGE